VRIALRDISEKGVEIGERQNRCHDDKQLITITKLQNAWIIKYTYTV